MTTAAQSQAPVTSIVSPKTVNSAIKALFEIRNKKSKTEKPQLPEEDESVYLTVSLDKIPETHRTCTYRIALPHPLINTTEDSPELCLIIHDKPKYGLTRDDVVKKIKSENIPITKVLTLSMLKSEPKRKLCDSYERFFTDRRMTPLLPRSVGKNFFGSKKIPVAIDLKRRNWKEQIEKSCRTAMFFIRTGTCSVIHVGKLSMGRDEIVENVMATLSGVVDVLPDKWKYIRSFRVKLSESFAYPIYQTVPADLDPKIDPFAVKDAKNGQVLVQSENVDDTSKSVKTKKKKKGRIHDEVRYNESEILGDDEIQMNLEYEVDGDLNGSGDTKKRKTSAESEKLVKESKLKNVFKVKKLENGSDEAGGGLKAKTKKSKRLRSID
ncbi:hypothetical protein CARUB_v10025570mg [Capsella rubella]|uniref:Ribosomal protein L1 n=1 Tax=Capsella rubella TaxID=81985 RepID=R0HYX3_9BRAS|nr:ribosomal L1 domain-containing protein 1 [Capsella rubella]EOA29288.1 hypothetical protein CARUB_v10025570mg [Capsella rubella]